MVHPTVQALPMENVSTVLQPPDLFPSFLLVQANGTVLRWLPSDDNEPLELYNGEALPPGQCSRFGCCLPGRVIRPNNVRLEEIREPEAAKNKTEYRKHAEDGFW
ncbi:hypothetical protein GQ457_15G026200 [Hibiscus cannabinus]